MTNENTLRQQESVEEVKTEKHINNVIVVQALVCTFIILLIVAVGRVSPNTFEAIREEYSKIMSVDMDRKDVVDSVKSIIPVVTAAAETTAPPEAVTQTETTEKKAVAAMASLSSTDKITVPVHGKITSRFGGRENPISGVYAQHTGIDIAADSGTDILAAYDGVVESTGTEDKAGNYVKLLHSDGSETLYCHCSEIIVDDGDAVRAGDTIALVGETGWATGPHLHFEIHIDGERTDPLDILNEKDGRV